jgi:hypothetical protein
MSCLSFCSPARGSALNSTFVIVLVLSAISDRTTALAADTPSFRNEVMAVLSRTGCNLGTCHGNQHGKGGLKLSLRGENPAADYLTLTRQLHGRRFNPLDPPQSLLLLKPTMEVPHEGGRRFTTDSAAYDLLQRWIAAGLPDDDPAAPQLVELRVSPQQVTREAGTEPVQLQVQARFSDESWRDVTELCVYESSSIHVEVSSQGEVRSSTPQLTTLTVRYLHLQQPVRLEFVRSAPDFVFTSPPVQSPLDELVFRQLERLRINPAPLCDDSTFIRRAYLDLTGLLPPPAKAREFVASTATDKRSRLIDELLASAEFVDQQTQRWADLLRVEEKTLDSKGLQVYHQWIHDQIAANVPLNDMLARLIEARGSTYTVPETNFFRALRTPEELAESTAQMLLGVRLSCAKCHNHPFDRWTQDDYYNWTNFFARIDYEIIENKRRDTNDKHEFVGEQIVKIKTEGEVKNARTGRPASLAFLGDRQPQPRETETTDRLQLLAAWIRDPGNERLAAMQANRIWYQLFGRGIVDPIDDFRATNPPSNPELLQAVVQEFVRSGYDTRQLLRWIMNSSTYQLASVTNETNATDELCFSHVIPRRLSAEQTLDAAASVIGSSVPYGGHPRGTRAVQLVGVRNGEFRYAKPEIGDKFLRLFGRPNRLQSCECERSDETTLAQAFELLSGELLSQLFTDDQNRLFAALNSDQSAAEYVHELYWSAFSRSPSAGELEPLVRHIEQHQDRRQGLEDVLWAVLNSNEFLLRR